MYPSNEAHSLKWKNGAVMCVTKKKSAAIIVPCPF